MRPQSRSVCHDALSCRALASGACPCPTRPAGAVETAPLAGQHVHGRASAGSLYRPRRAGPGSAPARRLRPSLQGHRPRSALVAHAVRSSYRKARKQAAGRGQWGRRAKPSGTRQIGGRLCKPCRHEDAAPHGTPASCAAFSHPDSTVGSGNAPDPPARRWCTWQGRGLYRRSGIGAAPVRRRLTLPRRLLQAFRSSVSCAPKRSNACSGASGAL